MASQTILDKLKIWDDNDPILSADINQNFLLISGAIDTQAGLGILLDATNGSLTITNQFKLFSNYNYGTDYEPAPNEIVPYSLFRNRDVFLNYFNEIGTGQVIELKDPYRISLGLDYISSDVPTNSALVNWSYIKNYVDVNGGGNLEPRVALNEQKIGLLQNYVDGLENEVKQNTADITTNKNNITTHTSEIATNKTDIATNKNDIGTNKTDITTNTTNITANKNAIDNIPASWTKTTQTSGKVSDYATQIKNSMLEGHIPYYRSINPSGQGDEIRFVITNNTGRFLCVAGTSNKSDSKTQADEIEDITDLDLSNNSTLTYWIAPSNE